MAGIEFGVMRALSTCGRVATNGLLRKIGGSLSFLLLFSVGLPLDLVAQFKFREPPNRQAPASLDATGGTLLWRQFINARQNISFRLFGEVAHRPAERPSTSYEISLQAEWGRTLEETWITLKLPTGEALQRSVRSAEDVAEIEYMDPSSGAWVPLRGIALAEAIFAPLPLTWQDLMMPFLKWEPVIYLGPKRSIGRPAHVFRLRNPDVDASLAYVDVVLDEDFAALLEATFHATDGTMLQRLRVTGFKEFPNGWMFSGLVWEDRAKRSSTRLEVLQFEMPPAS